MPKISFITRTKNRNILLERAINSTLNQTFTDFEMIIVNDGGEKAGVDSLVEKYSKKSLNRIRVIHNDVSLGMEAASNVGIKNSDSDFVLIHDDDDSLHPIFSEVMVEHFKNNPTSYGAICWSVRILEEVTGNTIKINAKEDFNKWLDCVHLSRLLADNVFPPISFLYKRSVFDKIGYYDETLPVLGDWEFNVRFMLEYDIDMVKQSLAYYHHRLSQKEGSMSNSVIGGNDKHLKYQCILRNKWLREDIKGGSKLGSTIMLAKSMEGIHENVNYSRNLIYNSIAGVSNQQNNAFVATNIPAELNHNHHATGNGIYDNISLINHLKYKISKRLNIFRS